MEKKRKKKGKTMAKFSASFSFTQNTSALSRCIQNLKTLAFEKSVTKNLTGEKEKK